MTARDSQPTLWSPMKFVALAMCALNFFLGVPCHAATSVRGSKPNVLFIAVDDLNHWVGHLGRNPQTKTPNLDRLAAMGVTFTRAYCAAPICNPSRAALLSGKRPSATGVYDNRDNFRTAIKEEETLITAFKKAGYTTFASGKIFHGGLGWPSQWDGRDGGHGREPAPKENRGIGPIKFGTVEGADGEMRDYHIASYGIEQLGKQHEKPFFLALGFHKPHMPWNIPEKYFDMHPLDKIELPPHHTNDLDDLPPAGVNMARAFGDHEKVLASGRWKEAVQAYLAAISFLDGQVGRVLDALEKSPDRTNTLICFWGDHGWHLGEKEHWRKFALWEESTRAPFIWVVPGVTKPGGRCERTVDFMSVYPTLCELAGLEIPKHVEGASLKKLLSNPAAEWTTPAVTTHGHMNHAARTERWRYIRYADGGEELYDHTKDPYEWTNLAMRAEFAKVKAGLAESFPKVNRPAVAGRNAADAEAGEPDKK